MRRTQKENEDDESLVTEYIELELHDKLRACELLGRDLGLFKGRTDRRGTVILFSKYLGRGPDKYKEKPIEAERID